MVKGGERCSELGCVSNKKCLQHPFLLVSYLFCPPALRQKFPSSQCLGQLSFGQQLR